MLCPQCNTNVPDGSAFCENCGAPLTSQVQQEIPAASADAGQSEPAVAATIATEATPQANGQAGQQVAASAQPANAQYQQPSYGQPDQQAYQQPSYGQPADQQYQQYQQPGQPYQQPVYGQPMPGVVPVGSKSKVAAGLLGIFLGAFGAHKFYLGYTAPAVIMLVVTLVGGVITLGIAAAVMSIIGLIEGIMYLVKSDWDFYQTYVVGQKQWF